MKLTYMYPSIRFRPRLDGKFKNRRIYCFILFNGKLANRFSTSIEGEKYDLKRQIFTGVNEESEFKNNALKSIKTDILKTYEFLKENKLFLTATSIRDTYLSNVAKRSIKTPTLIELFRLYIRNRVANENIERGTIEKIEIALKHTQRFLLNKSNRQDIEIQDITAALGNEFYNYLLNKKNVKGNNLSSGHCFRMYKTLSKALDYGVSKSYITTNELLKSTVRREKESHQVFSLTEDEVMKVYHCDGVSDTEKKIIEGFVLMCYTGLRHADYVRFLKDPKKYIFKDDDGFEYIEIKSFKNRKDEHQESSYIPLQRIVVEILARNNYELPSYCDQVMNRYLKQIGKRAGIKDAEKITTYTGRKSMACIFGNKDGVEIKAISKILGHKKVSTTETYYFRVNKETVKRQFMNLR